VQGKSVASSAAHTDRVRWAGAGSIPAKGVGYWYATWPLVVVELDRETVTVRLRPALFGRLVGAEVLTATPAEVAAYPVGNSANWQGIEFRPVGWSSFYFFAGRRDQVLKALAQAGFTVSSEPGRERPV
jgi:hypothetical protein